MSDPQTRLNNEPMTPAQRLLGLTLRGGWKVIKKLKKDPTQSGGYFSQGYIVERQDGRRGFLKALDYALIFEAEDPAEVLAFQTNAFVFERTILKVCRERRLDRVIEVIDEGSVRTAGGGPADVVQYLIFELADGDARRQANLEKRYDAAWALRALHHVTTGLSQLHNEEIAHQDLKLSNVLTFGRELSKVGDLGRSASASHASPHDEEEIAGDLAYAPPEHLYRAVPVDWRLRRFGCDLYLLGSLIPAFFLGAAMTPLVQQRLAPDHRVSQWRGRFAEVLPYVRRASDDVLETLSTSSTIPNTLAPRIVSIARELCDPDPLLRGHPFDRQSSQHSLRRYISAFDLLAGQAEIESKGAMRNTA